MRKPGTPKLSDVIRQRDDAVTTLKLCADKFRQYTKHHMQKGDDEKTAANALMLMTCGATIKRAMGGGSMKLNPKVGDKLWRVLSGGRGSYETTVTKVGSKWIYFREGRGRCDFDGNIDGGNYLSPGTCYPTKEVYEAELALRDAWCEFTTKVSDRRMPKGMTVEKIQQAKDLLFREGAQ